MDQEFEQQEGLPNYEEVINPKLFSTAANDKPGAFEPIDLNNVDNIDSEQLEDPELVKHIAEARKLFELDIEPKKLSES